jgi:hypothetical protein
MLEALFCEKPELNILQAHLAACSISSFEIQCQPGIASLPNTLETPSGRLNLLQARLAAGIEHVQSFVNLLSFLSLWH